MAFGLSFQRAPTPQIQSSAANSLPSVLSSSSVIRLPTGFSSRVTARTLRWKPFMRAICCCGMTLALAESLNRDGRFRRAKLFRLPFRRVRSSWRRQSGPLRTAIGKRACVKHAIELRNRWSPQRRKKHHLQRTHLGRVVQFEPNWAFIETEFVGTTRSSPDCQSSSRDR
jgi:hypothetical protein